MREDEEVSIDLIYDVESLFEVSAFRVNFAPRVGRVFNLRQEAAAYRGTAGASGDVSAVHWNAAVRSDGEQCPVDCVG